MEGSYSTEKSYHKESSIERKKVLVIHEGKEIAVNVDYSSRSENDSSITQDSIFIPGFGVGGTSAMDGLANEMKEEISKIGGRFIQVSIDGIPPGFDNKSKDHKNPSTDVDARVALKALEQVGINDIGERPLTISGYSEGSSIAVSLAAEVQKIQQEKGIKNKNTLRLFSIIGVVPMSDKPVGWRSPLQFSKEVAGITITSLANKYNEIRPKDRPAIKNLSDRTALQQLGAGLFSLVASPEGRKQVREKWRESREGDITMLAAVAKRIVSNPDSAVTQFKKLETRNPACDEIGKDWNVVMIVPRSDQLYPWMNTLMLPQINNDQTSTEHRPNDGNHSRQRLGKRLFPHAGEVTLIPMGDKANKLDIDRTHMGPPTHADLFVNRAPIKAV